MSFGFTTFRKPKARPIKKAKQLKKVGAKGEFWLFVSQILNRFFLRVGVQQRCQKCDGTSQCGQLTPAHTRRRQDIRRLDWKYALRVVPLGVHCHFEIDSKGRRDAEPILEELRDECLKRVGLTDARAEQILLECALEIQAEDALSEKPKYQEYLVEL
jgi:hypothetical protein